jgi:drug/metabolite transporter (DMT)-like permease
MPGASTGEIRVDTGWCPGEYEPLPGQHGRRAISRPEFPLTPPASGYREQNIPLGIAIMVGAIFLFSMNDVLGKWLAASYAAPQILLFRSVTAIIVLIPVIWRIGFRSLIDVERPWLQAARAVLATIEVAFFYWSVAYLPLADAMTYYLAGPIYVTVMAAVFLREKVGWRRWSAVLVGFIGVVIALGPSAISFGWPALIAFAGSIIYAVFLVVTRTLRGTPDSVMAAWQIGCALVLGVVGAPFVWVPLAHWQDGFLLCLLGVVALMAIIGVNRSLALAPASVVVPYQYTMIVWAVIFGYLVFGNIPKAQTLIGAAIIVAAGLFIYFREQKIGLPVEPELPPER